jgi:hypothetical protein
MSRRVTIPFHVSSEAADDKGSGVFQVKLTPELQVGHTAHPTVYLNNLSFTNTFANIDKALYDNADLQLQIFQGSDPTPTQVSIALDAGNYSLSELEVAIAEKLYAPGSGVTFAAHKSACTQLHSSVTLHFADKHALGSLNGVAVNTLISATDVQLQPVTVTPDAATGVQFKDALTIAECQHLLTGNTFPIAADAASGSAPNVLPPLSKGYLQGSDLTGTTMLGFKPVTLEADFEKNRVRIQLGFGVSMTAAQQTASTLLSKVLGVTSAEALSTVDHDSDSSTAAIPTPIFQLFDITQQDAASIDKTRGVAFHCPSLASGTYSTKGAHGDSQLALVPITVPVGAVQSWETFEPIRIPAPIAGTTRNELTFYITNEEGEPVNTLGERFEAVMVVEYDVPLKR